jgi:SAM-dependent methyltransferase
MPSDQFFWEDPVHVERFAARQPDHRLLEILDQCETPEALRVLDLGCAGGRNTVVLADRGCQVWALDGSAAMVAKTRERVAPILGEVQAAERVLLGSMDDLSRFEVSAFDLVVALGIYHNASSTAEWNLALAETARVLCEGGELLVANFDPRTDLTGKGVSRVPGELILYSGLPSGNGVLVDAATLEAEMAKVGLVSAVPSETVTTQMETGHRVVVNALFRKEP